jgi:DNA-binding transcriptional LysR family regulator
VVEIREIDAFLAVAREGSFTRAGKHLHLVQSAVSAAVARLEADLGVTLFERLPRSVVLTADGRRFLPHAQSAMTSLRAGRDAVLAEAGNAAGSIVVGYVPSTEFLHVPALLAEFVRLNPQVHLGVKTAAHGSKDLVELLRSGHVDAAFASVHRDDVTDLRVVKLGTNQLSFICPATSPWAVADRVELRQLAHETFIDFPPGYGIRAEVDRAFARAGITRSTSIEATHVHMIADMVASGLGVAFLPAAGIAGRDELVSRTVTGTSLTLPITVATRREGSKASVAELCRLASSPQGRELLLGAPIQRR